LQKKELSAFHRSGLGRVSSDVSSSIRSPSVSVYIGPDFNDLNILSTWLFNPPNSLSEDSVESLTLFGTFLIQMNRREDAAKFLRRLQRLYIEFPNATKEQSEKMKTNFRTVVSRMQEEHVKLTGCLISWT